MPASRNASPEGQKFIEVLNRILELELAGVVRYMHYSFMIFGHHRIPIVAWLRASAFHRARGAGGKHVTCSVGTHRSRSADCSRRTSTASTTF
jgi:bacterioferritin